MFTGERRQSRDLCVHGQELKWHCAECEEPCFEPVAIHGDRSLHFPGVQPFTCPGQLRWHCADCDPEKRRTGLTHASAQVS